MNEPNHLHKVPTSCCVDIIEDGICDIPMLQILNDSGKLVSGATMPDLSKEIALKILHTMEFIRLLDERMIAAQRQGRISFYLACTGEEAATAASAAALSSRDMIMSQYREQAALAYRGYTTEQFMNQMFSNRLDPNKGRQMPIHYGDKALNFMTISSPLGTQIPQAAGYAYGQKMQGEEALTICYFGEGAASEGDFHAGLNMAAVLDCPVIFFCRNNGYAISTPSSEQFKGDGIASRGMGYGIKTIRVDGNDALAVFIATQKARQIALTENCPVLIEAMTYRLAAHSTSDDPSGYRSKEEEAKWQDRDPISRFKQWVIDQGWFDESAHEAFIARNRQDILAAVKTAEKVPICNLDDMVNDVYDKVPWHLEQQMNDLKTHLKKYPESYPNIAEDVK
jgi:2-oxoisovalerate dehydrogenase E1 component alpha subunit